MCKLFFRKKELCERKRKFPSTKGRQLADDFGISEQAVSKILKRSSHCERRFVKRRIWSDDYCGTDM